MLLSIVITVHHMSQYVCSLGIEPTNVVPITKAQIELQIIHLFLLSAYNPNENPSRRKCLRRDCRQTVFKADETFALCMLTPKQTHQRQDYRSEISLKLIKVR